MSLKFNPTTGNLDVVLDKASEIKYDGTTSGLVATNVQGAVDELQSTIAALPDPIVYKGTWDASTNTPTLANTDTGVEGFLYQVNVSGSVNFGAGSISFEVGDKVVNNGSSWQKWDMTDAVTSVNGQVGAVVLSTTDISEGTNLYFTDERAQDAVGNILTDTSTIDFTYNDGINSITADVKDSSITNTKIATGIDATKIADGSVTNTEYQYLSGVTSDIQTQIDGKQATGNYITGLTGDVTASGPGSVAATLATVNSNVGSFGTASNVSTVTVNAKGLVTAASNTPIQIAESQVTNLVTDLANKADKNLGNILPTTSVDFNAQKLSNVADPTLDQDVVTNKYAKSILNGPKNYLGIVNNVNGNGNFELGTTSKWSLARTTLSSLVPNQASGSWTAASANLSISAVTSGKLAGSYSLQMVSSTASTAGDMLVSDAFTIDTEDQAKVLTFKAYYSATSGASNLNFSGTSANTLQFYIYDVTNSAWIQPAGVYGMTQGSGVGIVTGTFQTTSNSTQYRLAVININASADAYTILMDDFFVGPQTAPIGAVVTDWQSYTPAFQGFGTPTGIECFWRRDGDTTEIRGRFTSGTATAVEARIGLPSGQTSASTSQIPSITIAGTLTSGAYSTTYFSNTVLMEPSVTYVTIGNQFSTTNGLTKSLGNSLSGGGLQYSFFARVPIQGWSSNVQMSNDTDTRVVASRAYLAANQTGVNPNNSYVKIAFDTTSLDTNGAFDTTNKRYNVQVSGNYKISPFVSISSINVLNSQYLLAIYKNSSIYTTVASTTPGVGTNFGLSGSTIIPANAGDYFETYLYGAGNNSSSTLTVFGNNTTSGMSIERLSGPATIAANETVACRYAGGTTSVTTGNEVTLLYTTKTYDTHNAYNTSTGLYTVPVSGKYSIKLGFSSSATISATAINRQLGLIIKKNGTAVSSISDFSSTTTAKFYNIIVCDTVNVNAGDTISAALYNDLGNTVAMNSGTTGGVYLTIERVGN